jgi:predicted CXXCH cytochrome family protein
MKKTFVVLALAVAFVLMLSATALAVSARTWNYATDYYSWGSYEGDGAASGNTLGAGGNGTVLNTNPTAGGGVHSNYAVTTAKCGICHSVHRAKSGGVKLLNTADATCAGCHIAGTSTVTNVVIAWGTAAAPLAGPHGSGNNVAGSCTTRACHSTSPHGVGGSIYGLFAAKLLRPQVDAAVAGALANSGASGIDTALLAGVGQSTNFTGASDAVRVGYTCNSAGCHTDTMLPVVKAGWGENRATNGVGAVAKTGHISVQGIGATSFKAATSCIGCHDQVDSATRTGFTFPHAERATGSGAGTQNYLWYNIAGDSAGTDAAPMTTTNMKSFDGACLKCHRSTTSGVGIAY